MMNDLKKQVRDFPTGPGVYRMRDDAGTIIYVGKAKNLRNRVRSYFLKDRQIKTQVLMSKVREIEYLVTDTEYEALLLENNLIKELRPQYNIDLKDGKTYPVIRLTADEYPRIFRTRTMVQDGSLYFGPYTNLSHLDTYMELIDRLFPLRKCRGATLRRRKKPCLYYHIGRCAGVCAGMTSREEYMERVDGIRELLSGNTGELVASLESEMAEAAEKMEYERAATLRDSIASIRTVETEQNIFDFDPELRDYIGYASRHDAAAFVVFQMRGGKLVGSRLYFSRTGGTDDENIAQFCLRFYSETGTLPARVYSSAVLTDLTNLEAFFRNELDHDVRISAPETARDGSILRLATENARQELDKRLRESGDLPALQELQKVLGLPRLPLRIEGFDIAHIGGKHTVASMVSFSNGVPDRAEYRRFKMKSLKEGQIDDFASMRETVARRYTRVKNERLPRPDLILIDGGKGQLSATVEILTALELDQIPVVGLAKQNEEIFLPGRSEPVRLPEGAAPLRILQHVRDEAHRFATGYRAGLQKREIVSSTLEKVPGIGRERARRLLTAFSSLDAIAETPEDIVARSTGIPLSVVKTMQDYIRELRERQ